MRLEDLQLFLVIAEIQNLHRAAEHTGLSQSALTKALRRVEDEVGVRLFERAPRGLVPTEMGRTFAARVQIVTIGLQEALQELDDMRASSIGVVRLGSVPPVIEEITAPVVQHLLRHRPSVRFELSVHSTAALLSQLLDGTLDLVVALVPPKVHDDLEHEIIYRQRMQLVVRKHHPLIDSPTARTADLANVRWLLQPKGRMTRQWVEAQLAACGLPPPVVAVETDASAALIASLVPQGELATLLNLRCIPAYVGMELIARDDVMQPLVRPLAIYRRRSSYLSPLVAHVAEVLKQTAALLASAERSSPYESDG